MEERDMYWQRSELYRDCLLERVFKDHEDSISIMIFPIEVGNPNYRESDLPLVTTHSRWIAIEC